MVVRVKIKGTKVFIKNINRYRKRQSRELGEATHSSALVVQNEARRLVKKGPKTGKVYPRGKRAEHRASAPGQPPASDTGTLARNIIAEANERDLSARVIAKTRYSRFLEYGTKRMKERPFLRPALRNSTKKIIRIFQSKLRGL